MLEEGRRKFPTNGNIRANLAWAYFHQGNVHQGKGQTEAAYLLYKRFFVTLKKNSASSYTAYLYKLIHLKRFSEGSAVLKRAQSKFGLDDALYKAGFWLHFHMGRNYKKKKQYRRLIAAHKKLYEFAVKRKVARKKGRTFKRLALLQVNVDIQAMIHDICPYYKKFTPPQRSRAYKLMGRLKPGLHPDLRFVYYTLKSMIKYREGKTKEAEKLGSRAYDMLLGASIGREFKQTIVIPFPLKGTYLTGGNSSASAITHMGLHKHAYDIFGCDAKGRIVRPGGKRDTNQDYYGFGAPITSPISGKVTHVEDGHPDDPASNSVQGAKGNSVIIRSGNKLYVFIHLKHKSALVKEGQQVRRGQSIARLGNSSSTIPHLHFGVYSLDWLVTYPVRFTNYVRIKGKTRKFLRRGWPGGKNGFDIIEVK